MRAYPLQQGWQLARAPAGELTAPEALSGAPLQWTDALVPGTVATSLAHDIGKPADFDAHDWWYRTTFALPAADAGARWRLELGGLASLAEVWLNGQRIVASDNMFLGHSVDVTVLLRDVNQLAIRFASLEAALAAKRPRPRWKTALVAAQNLRWFRTTLVGRMPGWSPPVPAVGPYGGVTLVCVDGFEAGALDLQASAEEGRGRLKLRARITDSRNRAIAAARVVVDGVPHELTLLQGDDAHVRGDLDLSGVPLWWPHTHGAPALVPWRLEVASGGAWHLVEEGRIGFRGVRVDDAHGGPRFVVNGVPVFCRGACWTPADVLAIHADPAALRATLERVRASGANMIRVGGTMAYESRAFYALCDELGLLVWQDFMFANMDYPFRDPAFRAGVEDEVRYQLGRLQRHACIAAYCGGSEVAQQAAMMGLGPEHWSNEFFDTALPALCAEAHAGVPYFPSSPWGGPLPFHVSAGIAHYYGVGAYRRPIADVRGARVKFATECLGFSNIPEDANLAKLAPGDVPQPHHPRWKARVPRDNGAGYDFEDVRDHYLAELFGEDAVALRAQDPARYRALSRVASGEVMRRVYAQWRSPGDACSGALVWFLRDLWPGAGWGLLDSDGEPKAAWWALRRAWQPRTLLVTDEGLDGLALHVVNDAAQILDATLEVAMFRDGRTPVAKAEAPVLVPARGAATRSVDALLGYFSDCANAYRFGPPKCDVVVARLRDNETHAVVAEEFHFPAGMRFAARPAALERTVTPLGDGRVAVTLASDTFLQSLRLVAPGFECDDNYFHLAPGGERRIVFTPRANAGPFRLEIEALNLPEAVAVRLEQATPVQHTR